MFKTMKTFIAVAALSGTVSANVQAATITVQKGDNLWNLSRVHNTTVVNIKKLNHLTTDLIIPGEVLTIAPESHYIVKQGDTLWDIARAHHVSVAEIKEWNQLFSDLIFPGQNLLIYAGVNTANADKPAQPRLKAQSVSEPVVQASEPKNQTPPVTAASSNGTGQRQITVKATAYTASCEGCSGVTATGINIKANPNEKVIAVDPKVIPLGSKVYVEGFGYATAADTGGAIKGNRIDVFIPSERDAINFGVKHLTVTILN